MPAQRDTHKCGRCGRCLHGYQEGKKHMCAVAQAILLAVEKWPRNHIPTRSAAWTTTWYAATASSLEGFKFCHRPMSYI
eukprot:356014-Chlamydomonas_euryale.AAC.4